MPELPGARATLTAKILALRFENPGITLNEIARKLETTRDYVSQVIAKKRKKGVLVPAGTSTSNGHIGKFTFKLKRKST